MRIVHILTRLLRAGSEENTLITSAGQIARGHEVFVVHGHEAIREHAQRIAPDAQLVMASNLTRALRPARDMAAYSELRSIMAAIRPDVVHTHQSKAGIIGRFAAASARVPLIVHGVHILPFINVGRIEKTAYLWSERSAARVTDGFIHVSDAMRRACLEHDVGAGGAHFVVPSGFDLLRFSNAVPPDDLRDISGDRSAHGGVFVIAMLAALEERKQHLEFLRNAAPFLKANPRIRVLFAGEGHLSDAIRSEIAALGLEGQVRMLGYRTDPERVIALADVCVHCSEREGLPRSVLQYLAGGKPITMFDLPGIEDIVTDGKNGFILRQGDWAGLVNRIALLASDASRRDAVAAEAARTDLSAWDASLMGDRTLEIYESLRQGDSRRGRAA
jgi:glycosyltransferase involved in cell wall biosynthesis